MAGLPARWISVGRMAFWPQAMVRASSSVVPGCLAFGHFGGEHLVAFALGLEKGAGGGVEGQDLAQHLIGGGGEIEFGLGLVDLAGVGETFLGLRHGREGGQIGQYLHDQFRAQPGQFDRQLSRRLARDGRAHAGPHRAGVQTGFHLHDVHAGLLVSGQNRALDRRGARQRGRIEPCRLRQPCTGASSTARGSSRP
jgi:hypothetical protein